MPIYEYECACGKSVEVLSQMGNSAPQCSYCGALMNRLISSPAVIRVLSKGKHPQRSRGYKEDYSKEYLKSISDS